MRFYSKVIINVVIVGILLFVNLYMFPVLPTRAESVTNGSFIWVDSMGGTGWDGGYSIATDIDRNVYITGQFEGTVDFDPGEGVYNLTSEGGFDAFISKLDANGRFIWAKSIGGKGEINSNDWASSIFVDAIGNVYTTGSFYSDIIDFDPGIGTINLENAGNTDVFISKLNSNGNFIWAKTLGGIGYEFSSGIVVDKDGNVYTTGDFGYLENTADFDPGPDKFNLESTGNTDIFVSKLDSDGNFVWAKHMGGVTGDNGYAIAIDSSGNILLTGGFDNTAYFGSSQLTSVGDTDIFVTKVNGNGEILWAYSMGGNDFESGRGIAADSKNNIYLTGHFHRTVDFFPGTGVFNLTSKGENDIFVVKLDNNGTFLWANRLGGTKNDVGIGLTVSSNNVYTTGSFEGTADFDPGKETLNLTSAGLPDIFISSLDSTGNFAWAKRLGGQNYDAGISIRVDSENNILTTGHFKWSADFDPDVGESILISKGSYDIFVSKLGDKDISVQTNDDSYLPKTGFTPDRVTYLPDQPSELAYTDLGSTWLEIPSQKIHANIVGIPQTGNTWDVSWLGQEAGWLHGTAFPTWEGNSVITAHNTNSNGLPGPFTNIKELKFGDQIIIHLFDEQYTYEVIDSKLESSASIDYAFEHLSGYSYITLITCQGYNPQENLYTFRRVVRAVLVNVK